MSWVNFPPQLSVAHLSRLQQPVVVVASRGVDATGFFSSRSKIPNDDDGDDEDDDDNKYHDKIYS